jgi:transposase
MDAMTSESKKTRRRYGAQFKAMVLAQCEEPGVSVAQVAMSHGINDNVVHRWRQLARDGKATPPKASEFIALPMTARRLRRHQRLQTSTSRSGEAPSR